MKRLFSLLTAVFLLSVLGVRIGYWQLIRGEEMRKEAMLQQTRDRAITSKRGTIYDRNGKELAVSASVELVSVSPAEIQKNKGRVPKK